MKKKTKQLLLLAAVLVLLVAGYFALDFIPEDAGEEGQNIVDEAIEVAEFDMEEISSYHYNNSVYEIGFSVTENGYVHADDPTFPVNTSSVATQLETLAGLTALQVIESKDKAEYGLDAPRVTISLTLSDGTERTFLIGDSALFEAGDYLLDVEKDRIYLIGQSLYTSFSTSWSSLVKKEELVMVSSNQIVDVTVETAGEQTMYICYDEAKENPWQLTTPEGTFDGDSDAVLEALGMYNSYAVGNVAEYNCADFSQYGLENPETTVTVRYNAESGEVRTQTFAFGNVNEEESFTYVRINHSPYVYGMTKYYKEGLSLFDLEELKYQTEEAVENGLVEDE